MENITVAGLVATTPRFLTTQEGVNILSFRLASSERFFNKETSLWDYNSNTNWYTINVFGETAKNARDSIEKGHRIVVAGRLELRDWDNGERSGTSAEVEADSIGHDLTWGTSQFTRTVMVRENAKEEPAPIPAPVEAHSCNCQKCER